MPAPRLPPPGHPPVIPSTPSLDELHRVMVLCTRCDLFLSRTQVVPGVGARRPPVLIVGEAPGEKEDRSGEPFVGRSGALLDTMLASAGLARRDVFIANVVRCRPPANRNPRAAELRACAGWMAQQVRLLRPRVVVTLGRFALQHFVPGGKISALQGVVQPLHYESVDLLLYPLLHPSAVLRNPDLRDPYRAQFEKLPEILARI